VNGNGYQKTQHYESRAAPSESAAQEQGAGEASASEPERGSDPRGLRRQAAQDRDEIESQAPSQKIGRKSARTKAEHGQKVPSERCSPARTEA
jgi:hypothetical protein